ncbi:MAG: hypothetical protein M1587_01055 [Thaumarchaeota archaeon]|nr:hypothetical protein [Nitrososphaerota archaeon]MDG6906209.1 hypothetical protein [Nitrososphaerota archaeon]
MANPIIVERVQKDGKQVIIFESHKPIPKLPEGEFTEGQSWAALKKSWLAFRIAKAQGNTVAMLKYADRIRSLQRKLKISISRFPEIGLN